MMNKFMLYWMPVMVWFFTYSLFAGLWLYWGIWTIFTIFQNLIVNKMLKK
jgi:membrane protein insertase Oxa1/YidC/SpoIIIJ